jgi:hypothetical protein
MSRVSTEETRDGELVARLRQLDVAATPAEPGYDYAGLLARDAAGRTRARRRHSIASGTVSALVLAMVAVSVWRLSPQDDVKTVAAPPGDAEESVSQPRLVRADTWLALAAIEDHIATIDDALSDARLAEPRSAEVARLERTRADLMDSYASVRYAEMVSTNF